MGVQTPALYVPRSRSRATSSADARLRHAYLGFRLAAVAGLNPEARIEAQSLLLSRFGSVSTALPDASRALDLRYVVQPATAANGWRERVDCFLLARYSNWETSSKRFRYGALAFSTTLLDLLASVLPTYQFEPLATPTEIAAALCPFHPTDTVEVRRRTIERNDGAAFGLPLLGVPDADALVELMLRQPHPTLLSCCVSPMMDYRGERPLQPREPVLAIVQREHQAMQQPTLGDNVDDSEAGPSFDGALLYMPLQARRQAALHMCAFRLRLQLVGADRLSDALLSTVAGEVGGPGRYTAGAAWRDPALPLAAGAALVRPRTSRLPRHRFSEATTALTNVQTLAFADFGVPEHHATLSIGLADLREAACLFALPSATPWLPAQSIVLPLPYRAPNGDGIHLGVNRTRTQPRPVRLSPSARNHHLWIVGTTGAGKTTLMESMILQDIYAGRGVVVIDPHGDLIGQIIGKVPAERVEDVILFDPTDKARPLGLNPLSVTGGEDAQALVVSDFIGLLTKLYDPHHTGIIGPRFEHNARNVMLTVMATPGNTLVEVLRAFQDDAFVSQHLLPNVTDPLVRRYWEQQIRNTNDFHRSEVLDWLVSKFSHFVTDPTMRRILGQSTSSFDFFSAMNSGKIVLLSLAKGILGAENATFLGLVLLPMVLHAALARAQMPETERRDVALYVDEFQNYATDSLALMLAEARKYHLGLTLANQHVGQLTPQIRDAVVGNVGSFITFRLGAADAVAVEAMLEPSPISAQHLVSLPNYSAYARLLVDGQRTPACALETEPVPHRYDAGRAAQIHEWSRMAYGRPREEVDDEITRRSHMLDAPIPRQRPFTVG